MNAWSNIEISSQDPEILRINTLEEKLGKLPEKVRRIRELITRFEMCHFKYQKHLQTIIRSIDTLDPKVEPTKIGSNHIQHGGGVLKNDSTGKSLIGQRYVWALSKWLDEKSCPDISELYDKQLGQQVRERLGEKDPEKVRLVGLLVARLTWDWKTYEKLLKGGEYNDVEQQIIRMDICHYAFPANLDLLIEGIGRMTAVEEAKFEGCGSFHPGIRTDLENAFGDLNDWLQAQKDTSGHDKNGLIKIWLRACLAKTIKEQIKLSLPLAKI